MLNTGGEGGMPKPGRWAKHDRWHTLLDAVMEFADVDSEDDVAFERARNRLREAAVSYANGLHRKMPAPRARLRA